MTTPARLLAKLLIPGASLPLRDEKGRMVATITYRKILEYIKSGTIEGVGSKSRIRFVRLTQKQVMEPTVGEEERSAVSIMTGASVTVYREPVRDEDGNIFARIWMHKGARL